MKSILSISKSLLICLILFLQHFFVISQKPEINHEYQLQIIENIKRELESRYVYPKKAKQINTALTQLIREGHFLSYTNHEDFAKELSKVIFSIVKDKHISVSIKPKSIENLINETKDPFEDWLSSRLEERYYLRKFNANFRTVDKKEGNIGYLDLRGFYGLDFGREFAKNAMAMLATSDAIIIDLRNNSGGRADMVNYLLSFFFDKQIITGKSVKRTGNDFVEKTSRTPKREENTTMPDIPLFVLTSNKTFSAAEAFSYPLKVYKRAIFVGEQTKGGANAGDLISLDEHLQIFIPDVAGLPHPVSGQIFERNGIEPDVNIDSSQALEKAMELAKIDAEKYRLKTESEAKELLIKLNEVVGSYDGNNEDDIVEFYLKCRRKHLIFEEWELTQLAKQFAPNNFKTALALYKTAAVIYPKSSSSQFDFSKALLQDNRKLESIKYLEMAIKIARKNQEAVLDTYQKELTKILSK